MQQMTKLKEKTKDSVILIAHRGLINGPDSKLENTVEQVEHAISLGFDAEVDVWYTLDTGFALGHDFPEHPVSYEWLIKNNSKLWIHAKNLDALYLLQSFNTFWHENDKHTLTSKGYIWSYPGEITTAKNGVMVMPESAGIDFNKLKTYKFAGICSDYVNQIKDIL